MAGWSHQKRVAFEQAFYAYLDNCEINSKDHGEPIILGEYSDVRPAGVHHRYF